MKRASAILVSLAIIFSTGVPRSASAGTDGTKPQVRTLDQLVQEVMVHNPELAAMESELDAARGQQRQAGFWKNPDLTAMYAHRRLGNPDATVGHGFSDMFGLTQTFEFPGKATLRKALASQDVALAELGLRQFRLALAGRVRLLAYRCELAQENQTVAEVVVGRSQQLMTLLAKRPKAGMQSVFDTGILRGNLAELLTNEREVDQETESAESELNILRGWPAQTQVRVAGEPIPSLPKDLVRYCLECEQTSPALQLKELALAHGKTQVAASKLAVAPDFAIQPYYSLDQAGDHDEKVGANLTVTLPIWNQNQGNIASAQDDLAKLGSQQEQGREELQLALEHDYEVRRLIARQFEAVGEDIVPQMADLADLADRQYRLGAISLQTFLETQRQYLSTARSINQARMQDIAAELDMELLSGKGPLAASGGKP